MKIKYASDLHVDINTKYYNLTSLSIIESLKLEDVDILILAGDTAEYPRNLTFIDLITRRYPNLKVIEIGGNHLYYSCSLLHQSIDVINKACKDFNKLNPNYYFLENSTITIDNIKFIGTTLWTKLGEYSGTQMKCVSALNDFQHIIRQYPHKLNARDCVEMCEKSRKFIVKEVNNTPPHVKSIVITHHAPFLDYVDDISHAFGINLTKTILRLKKKPTTWIYGHTHINKDVMIDSIPIVCNQFGYLGESKYDARFTAAKTFDGTKELLL